MSIRLGPAALTGLLFGVITVVGLFGSAAIAEGSYPMPDASVAEIRRFFAANATAVQLQAVWQFAASVLLVAFASTVGAAIRPFNAALASLAQAGGALAGAFFAFSAMLVGALGSDQFSKAAEVMQPAHLLGLLTGGAGHVAWLGVLVGAVALAGHRYRFLPRWITWTGFVSATLSLLSVLSLAFFAATPLLPLGRFTGILVLAATSIVLARGRTTSTPVRA